MIIKIIDQRGLPSLRRQTPIIFPFHVLFSSQRDPTGPYNDDGHDGQCQDDLRQAIGDVDAKHAAVTVPTHVNGFHAIFERAQEGCVVHGTFALVAEVVRAEFRPYPRVGARLGQ